MKFFKKSTKNSNELAENIPKFNKKSIKNTIPRWFQTHFQEVKKSEKKNLK